MAATWSVVRIERQPGADIELVCEAGQYPATFTLKSDDGRTFTVTACVPLGDPDPCTLLAAITPPDGNGDWEAACA